MPIHARSLRVVVAVLALLGATCLASCGHAQAVSTGVTHFRVTNQVILPRVTRLGINLGDQNYYDSGQMLKNLLARNPGFEGMSYRTILHCVYGAAARCVDTRQGIQFPKDFWDGANYEVLVGQAAGHRGTVQASGPANGGYTLALDAAGAAIGAGDWIAVEKQIPGDPTAGWWPSTHGGGQLLAERADLSPGTPGHQALRMEAAGAGQSAQVNSYFDSTEGISFIHLHGTYRLSFMAKGLAGNAVLHVHVRRLAPGLRPYLEKDVPLTRGWAEYHEDFSANEVNLPPAAMEAGLSVEGGSLLLDDVRLERIDGDPANKTAYSDEVVQTLEQLHPGVLRLMASYAGLGDTIGNLLAPPLARQRSGFRTWYDRVEDVPMGIPEFLALCQQVGADPWIVMPTAMSLGEARELVEYLSGGPATGGGTIRAAEGHAAPWTQTFGTIHLELGNETWNAGFEGESMEDPTAYGQRANAVFAAMRAAAGASAGHFDLVVGSQAYYPGRNPALLAASPLANSLAIAPYLMISVTQWANEDQLYGPLLAQPEQMSREGIVAATQAGAGGRQLAVYEVNLHTTGGDAPQDVLDRLTPSTAAGVAVAGHMLRMMRDHGVRDEMLFSLPQYRFRRSDGKMVRLWGSVVEMGADGRKRPQFLTESLANQAIRGDLVRVEVSGEDPTRDQPAGNDGVHLTHMHELDAYAFQDGTWHSLILFNYGLHQARRVSLEGPGLNASTRVRLARLVSPGPGATNEETVQVKVQEEPMQGTNLTLAPCSMAVLIWQ